jgi:hypothetical protein
MNRIFNVYTTFVTYDLLNNDLDIVEKLYPNEFKIIYPLIEKLFKNEDTNEFKLLTVLYLCRSYNPNKASLDEVLYSISGLLDFLELNKDKLDIDYAHRYIFVYIISALIDESMTTILGRISAFTSKPTLLLADHSANGNLNPALSYIDNKGNTIYILKSDESALIDFCNRLDFKFKRVTTQSKTLH